MDQHSVLDSTKFSQHPYQGNYFLYYQWGKYISEVKKSQSCKIMEPAFETRSATSPTVQQEVLEGWGSVRASYLLTKTWRAWAQSLCAKLLLKEHGNREACKGGTINANHLLYWASGQGVKWHKRRQGGRHAQGLWFNWRLRRKP